MRSVDVLVAEHRKITRMIAIIEAVAVRLASGGEVPSRVLVDVMDFSEHFTSNCHHAKEEHHLFPKLAEHGMSLDSSPIAALREQHDANHAYLREMHGALTRMRAGDGEAPQAFAASARDYARLLREHMRIEDHYFQDVSSLLSNEEDETLSGRMAAVDQACARAGDLTRFERMLDEYEELMRSW
jgi:hemerythrin-like domain-containing protein